MVKEANASLKSKKKNIDTEKKSQTYPEPVDTYKNNKHDTVDKVDKSRYIPVTNISNKSNQIKNPQK